MYNMSKDKQKVKLCKYCKQELPQGAKICPNCHKKQGLKAWQIVLIIIVVLGIFGAASQSEEDVSKEDIQSQETQQDVVEKESESVTETAEETEKTEYEQNEVATYEDVNYSVTNVVKTSGNDFDTAKDGYEYVVVTLKIENNSDEKISYNPLDWKMVNGNGSETEMVINLVDTDTRLSSGDLNPDGFVEGTIVFEQPEGDTGLKLNYYGNIFSSDPAFSIKIN